MDSTVDPIKNLKVEIANLGFHQEIFLSSETRRSVDELFDEHAARKAQLAELHARLDELVSALPATIAEELTYNRHCQLASSLPYEMLSAIFKNGPEVPLERTTFALSVSQVSRYWRETAMQTPFLWAGIPLLPRPNEGGYQEFLKVLMHRSQSYPLDITIRLHELDMHSAADRMKAELRQQQKYQEYEKYGFTIGGLAPREAGCSPLAELDIIISEVSRWHSFAYESDNPVDVMKIMGRIANLSAPILKSFDFVGSLDGLGTVPLNVFEGGAPILSRIRIGGIEPMACRPPLSSLTFIHLENPSDRIRGKEFLDVIRASPALVSLHLEGQVLHLGDLYQLALQGEHVEIATLRHFSFFANPWPDHGIKCILNTIRCPALESLTISKFDGWYTVDDIPSSQTLSLPPFPKLRSLELWRFFCSKFVRYFARLPALDTISLMQCSPTNLLHLILPSEGRDSGDDVWPVLRFIRLCELGINEFNELSEFILYRQACGKPMEAVSLDSASMKKFPEEVQWMKQHVDIRPLLGWSLL
jgi:hypothetical protein